MSLLHVPDPRSLILIILLVIAAAVVFWRIVLKMVIMGVLVLLVLGVVALLHGMH